MMLVRRIRPALAIAFITLAVGVQVIAVRGGPFCGSLPALCAEAGAAVSRLIRLSLRQMLTSLDYIWRWC